MNLIADPENDPVVLDSDLEQTLQDKDVKLKFAITTLKDIYIWCDSLDDVKAVAKYCLYKIGED